MGSATPSDLTDDKVTASDLARHFGHWQRRALKAPIYVLNHGRPQFVLASVEFMQALSAARPQQVGGELAELLDALLDPVLICDAAATVIAAGRAARFHFGKHVQPGAPLAAFLPADCAVYLGTIVTRVADSGLAERAILPGSVSRARLDMVVEPSSFGVVIAGRTCEISDARDFAIARETALVEAIGTLPGHAIATIGLRGLLIAPQASLARLTGLSEAALVETPVATLFSNGSRCLIENAVAAAFDGDPVDPLTADLIAADGHPMPVLVALAPLRRNLAIEAVQAVIMRQV